MLNKIYIVVVISCLLLSCNKVIDNNNFASVYFELMLNQENNKGNKTALEKGRFNIYNKYKVTEKDITVTLEKLNKNPSDWKEVYEIIEKKLGVLSKQKNFQ